ncbi:MAG TPA: hypothetical protein VKX28_18655 [Xanthobacteraceae bacterium]|nr:hypothetical protein [Xanthobacteraceae bacterium]
MSPSSEPAHTSSPSPGGADSAADAPKRVRDSGMAARKVLPLRLPSAPQLVPAAAPAAKVSGRRPTGPELLAEDEVLKRLLQRHSPDPEPLPVKPARDPVGLALGMIARLIVAGCAVAVAALLLLGVVPLPFRLGASVASETPAVGVAPAYTVAAAQPVAMAEPAPSPPATPVATVTVRAGEPMPADRWALDAGEIERLVKRGEDYLAQGDIAAARLILGRAAEARDARAALSLGATYDPAVLRKLHVVGFKPDIAQARAWYEKAAGYGSSEAAARLGALPTIDR